MSLDLWVLCSTRDSSNDCWLCDSRKITTVGHRHTVLHCKYAGAINTSANGLEGENQLRTGFGVCRRATNNLG